MKRLQSTLIATFALSLPVAAHAQSTFGDVPDNHWAAAAVKTLAQAGIIEGFPSRAESAPKIGAAPPQSTLKRTRRFAQAPGSRAGFEFPNNHYLSPKRNEPQLKDEFNIALQVSTALHAEPALKKAHIGVSAAVSGKRPKIDINGRVANQEQRDLATRVAGATAPGWTINNNLSVGAARKKRARSAK